ncbi:hypothetical protein GCM10025857_18950 [Alicyclobacillus contaminans]|nr:hypothetical protein GCM10025857_18950 [Alicyclobacillus contaminans]
MRRSERLIRITKYLLDRPNSTVSLAELADGTGAAKSSVSEDVAMIRDVLAQEELGRVHTIAGAGGGVRFQVRVPTSLRERFEQRIIDQLADPARILPGDFCICRMCSGIRTSSILRAACWPSGFPTAR